MMDYITDDTKIKLLNYITPIMCFLTINNSEYDIDFMYQEILKDELIRKILNEYILNYIEFNILVDDNINYNNIKLEYDIWRNGLDKYLLNNLAFKIKQELHETIKYPRKLLKLINEYTSYINWKLKPYNQKNLINFNILSLDISKIINQYLLYDITGFDMIDKLLDKLPRYIWYYKDLKWLIDTENNGVYCIVVFSRLMNTLYNFFPNFNERKHHILENMIYFYKNNAQKNNFWCKYILDPFNEFKLNIYDNTRVISQEKYRSSYIKFDVVIYNTWICSTIPELSKELKNIIFRLSKKKGLIVYTKLFNNINFYQDNKQRLEVYRKMINNNIHIYEITNLGSIKFKIDNINYTGYVLEKTRFKTTINIDGLDEVRII